MSKFVIDKKVFEAIPNVCFGAVAAYGIDNQAVNDQISKILEQEVSAARERLAGVKIKEYPPIAYYREAFQTMGVNPNRYANSVEALNKRIADGAPLPSINPIVDIGNAVSLKYTLPIGAHDIDQLCGHDLEVRHSVAADTFVSFGKTEEEEVPLDEIVYVSNNHVRTRRWIWRQSEIGKINAATTNVVFPIDGFIGSNDDNIRKAMEELQELLVTLTGCKVKSDFLTAENNFIEL